MYKKFNQPKSRAAFSWAINKKLQSFNCRKSLWRQALTRWLDHSCTTWLQSKEIDVFFYIGSYKQKYVALCECKLTYMVYNSVTVTNLMLC